MSHPKITNCNISGNRATYLIDIADAVCIMAYRDEASYIIDFAEDEVAYANLVGKPIFISIETNDIEPEWNTFYEEGEDSMKAVLQDVTFGENDFDGFAFHYYKHFYGSGIGNWPSKGTGEKVMYGDVSGNGRVMAFDAALILQETVGIITLPDPRWPAFTSEVADVSGDTTISAYDAALVLQYCVGLIERFPVEEGGSPKLVSTSRRVHLGSAEDLSDGSFVVPLLIGEMKGVLSGQIELSFDKRLFRGIRAARSDLTEGYLFAAKVSDDRVKLSFAGAESKQGNGRIAEVWFERIGVVSDGIEEIKLRRVQLNEGSIAVALQSAQIASEVPTAYWLSQNYPNPFNSATVITYQLPVATQVELAIYDVAGQKVRTFVSGQRDAGSYSVRWNGVDDAGRSVASGMYLYWLQAGDFVAVRKALLLR